MSRPFVLPGAEPHYAPDRVVDVVHIALDLALDVERRRIDGTCTTTVTPILGGVRALELDAVDLEIREVTAAGRPLSFAHDGRRLRIALADELPAGERLELRIAYGGSPRRGIYFVGPDEAYPDRPRQVWTQGQDEDSRFWFPCLDAPVEKATSEVRANVPGSFFALSNGVLVETAEADGGRKIYHWRFDVPHSAYLITLAAGELTELRDRWEDVDVTYYVQPGREDDCRRALGRTPEMLALFSERFGLRYPYPKYAQVFVAEFIFGGMENTTATTLTDAALVDARAALDYDVEALVAHELAHQWFGDLLTCRDWGQGWLNEGFATYSEYVWREHAHGADEGHLELLDWAEQYFGEDARRYRRPIATNVYEAPIDLFDHHLYEKGGLVLHMLRQVLGEDAFWRALGHYVRKHRTGSVETRDLARAVEEATGRNLDWFFSQWVEKAGHPELKVQLGWDAERKLARVAVQQTHKVEGETPLFRLPLVVRFRVGDDDVDRPLEIRQEKETFFFPLADEPTQMIFDAGNVVLKKAEVDKSRRLWIAELHGATVAADRIAAAHALAKDTSAEATAALTRALGDDPFWGVRAACAGALGELRTAVARDALVAALANAEHPKTRRAIVRALGELRHDEAAAAALERVVREGDASYFVEAEACLALGKTRSPRAAAALREALPRESYLDIIRQHVYRGLAAARDDEALPLLLEGMRYGKVSQGRRAAMMAAAQLVAGRQDRPAHDVRERLEELLEDPDFRVQYAAIDALATLGDGRAIGALTRVVERDLDGRLKRRAREVIRDLGEGKGGEGHRALTDEIDRLRGEVGSLRDRLARLEAQARGGEPAGGGPPPRRRPAAPTARGPASRASSATGPTARGAGAPRGGTASTKAAVVKALLKNAPGRQPAKGAPGKGSSGKGTPGKGTPGKGTPGKGTPGKGTPPTRPAGRGTKIAPSSSRPVRTLVRGGPGKGTKTPPKKGR